jgi:hypothetical protein
LHASKSSKLFHDTNEVMPASEDPRIRTNHKIWPLHEKGTFGAYTDLLQSRPRSIVFTQEVLAANRSLNPARHFRLAHRAAIHASEEYKVVFAVLPPACQVAHSAVVEKVPQKYPHYEALWLAAVCNGFALNAVARSRVGLNLSKYIRDALPVPDRTSAQVSFLAHSALRLTCNHEGYAPLWQEQLGDTWREPTPRHTWPVLAGNDARWKVRAAIDAVVAGAYGLSRDQYAHVLASFSHKSYPKAPELCLAAFDDLQASGLEAFTRQNDPYWDVPLVETLPKPVIDLPVPALPTEGAQPAAGAARKPAVAAEAEESVAAFRLTPSEPKKARKKRGT